jgi:hypothetical protein
MVKSKTNPTKKADRVVTKAKPKIVTEKRRVSFGTVTTSPNDTIVPLEVDKFSARDGINPTPASSSHHLYDYEILNAFGTDADYKRARKEAENAGEINSKGNAIGLYLPTKVVRYNTNFNENIPEEVNVRASRTSRTNGKGYKKTKNKKTKNKKTKKKR